MADLKEDFARHISSEFNEELEGLCADLLKMGVGGTPSSPRY